MDRRSILSMMSVGAGMTFLAQPAAAQTSTPAPGCCVSVKDYGAVGDGATDDTAAIQNALNASGDICFPAGNYVVSSTITIPSFRRLEGGPAATIWVATGSSMTDVFLVPSGNSDVVFRGINVSGNGDSTANAFHVAGGIVWLESCTTINVDYALISEGPLLFVSNCYFRGNNCILLNNSQAEVRGIVNTVCNAQSSSGYPLKITGVSGLRVTGCDLIAGENALLVHPGEGEIAASLEFVNTYFDQGVQGSAFIDSATGGGTIQRVKIANCWATSSKNGHGLRLLGTNTEGVQISNCNMYDNALSGISIESNECIVTGCSIAGNKGSGISVNGGVSSFVISSNIIGPYGNYPGNAFGIYINAGNGGSFTVIGNVLTGNTTPIVNGATGTNMIIASNAGA